MRTSKLSTGGGSILGGKKLILSIIPAIIMGAFIFTGIAFAGDWWANVNSSYAGDERVHKQQILYGGNYIDEVTLYSNSGTPIWSIMLSEDLARGPWFADMDGDGNMEFIFIVKEIPSGTYVDRVYCFGDNGELWEHQLDDDNAKAPLFADMNRDGGDEAIITYTYLSSSSKNITKIYVMYANGNVGVPNISDLYCGHPPSFADINGNGSLEIIIAGDYVDKIPGDDWKYIVMAFDGSATSLPFAWYSYLSGNPAASPVITNNNSDWKPTITIAGGGTFEMNSTATNRNPWPYKDTEAGWSNYYKSYSISGNVKYQGSNNNVIGATVAISCSGVSGGFSKTTGSNGSYKFDDFCNGDYTLTLSVPGYSNQSQTITVNGNNLTAPDFIVPTYSVSGSVQYGDGITGVASAIVSAAGRSGTVYNSAGDYTITSVPKGTYNVIASMGDYVFDPTPASIAVSGDTVGVNFKTYVINGYVTRSGTGINGINVTIKKNATPVATIPTTTGPGGAGYYEKKGLGGGTYTIQPAN